MHFSQLLSSRSIPFLEFLQLQVSYSCQVLRETNRDPWPCPPLFNHFSIEYCITIVNSGFLNYETSAWHLILHCLHAFLMFGDVQIVHPWLFLFLGNRRRRRNAKSIYLDQPFLFFVIQKDTQLVLLSGKLENPVQVPLWKRWPNRRTNVTFWFCCRIVSLLNFVEMFLVLHCNIFEWFENVNRRKRADYC